MSRTLYELDCEIGELLENGFNEACIDILTGEINFIKAKAYLDNLSLERNIKIENIALLIKNLDSEAEAIKQEERRLKQRREIKERKIEALKSYLKSSLLNFNQAKFETPRVAVSFRKSESVEVEDMSLLKPEYVNIEYTPNKKAIKEVLKAGAEVDGATLKENQNITIK